MSRVRVPFPAPTQIAENEPLPSGSFFWDPQRGDRSPRPLPILQHQRSAVPLGDLTAEDETDARPSRLGGEEGDEEVPARRQSGPVVLDFDDDFGRYGPPSHHHPAARFQRGVPGVPDQIDEE